MAITLLRHGALPKKYQNRYIGWSDISIDLELFEHKKVALLKTQKFDIVYSSDLIRCQQTLKEMNITDYTLDVRLREVRFKDEIEGLNLDQIEQLESYKSKYVEKRKRWHKYICEEPQKDFEARIKSFLLELPKDKEILICSHGGTLQKMMFFLGYAKGKIDYLENIRIDHI
jgi:broad specificity phosphatase PhoE